MNIIHICLCGPVTDGWSYQDNLLSKYHKKAGHEVAIITSKWIWGKDGKLKRDERDRYINENNILVVRLEMQGEDDFGKKLKRYVNVYETIQELNPDILFIHGVAFMDTTAIVKYLKSHPKVIAYADNHADFSNSATNWLSKNILHKGIWRYYARKLIPYVNKFYGVLPARVSFLTELYGIPEEKCKLLVMGADDDKVEEARKPEVRKEIREKNDIDECDFLIVTGGKIDIPKRQTLFLMDAVNQLEQKNVKLIIFGSVIPELKQEVKKRCSDRVKYIGWIDSSQSYSYFAAADLVVFPGRHSVFWEQVAGQGIPMLVKDWPGTHHVDVGGNVRFLSKDCTEEIKDELEKLLESPGAFREMKTVAEKKGMDVFSYRAIAERSIKKDGGCI